MRWLALILLVVLSAPVHAASYKVLLIRASNENGATDESLKDIETKLKKVFGYNHYRPLGLQRMPAQINTRRRLDLGEGFVTFITTKGLKDNRYDVELEWFSGKLLISKQTLKLPENRYVFIKGPEVGADWIVLALTILE